MKYWSFASGIIAACGFFTAAAAADRPPSVDVAAAVAPLFSEYSAAATPGCAVGIFRNGQSLLARGYGMADLDTGAPLDATTLFYTASTTKQFTALAVALLIEQRKLRLDDDVRDYLPQLSNYGAQITIAMLLHHTSGVGDYFPLFELAGLDRFDTLAVDDVLAMIVRQRSLQFTPGSEFSYSNSGYVLLAEIVARVSGTRFPDFVREWILAPLGMHDSYMRDGANPPGAKIAHGYVLASGDKAVGYVTKDGYPAFSGSGGLMTTIRDLQKFDRDFHIGHRVWSSGVRKLLLTPGRTSAGRVVMGPDGLPYASGLHVGTLRGVPWISHSGVATGFRSDYVRLPVQRAGVAVLCNRGDAHPVAMTRQIVEAVSATLGVRLNASPWPAPSRRPDSTAQQDSLPPSADLLLALQGRYRSDEIGADFVFAKDTDGRLSVTVYSLYAAAGAPAAVGNLRMLSNDILVGNGYQLQLRRSADGTIDEFSIGSAAINARRFVRAPSGGR